MVLMMNRRSETDKSRTNWFDDGVLDDKRVRYVVRHRRQQLHLREYNRGDGDWETFCRALAFLKDFYKAEGTQIAFADSIVHISDMCLTLTPDSSRHATMDRTENIVMLSGLIYVPALIGYCAVCYVKGCTGYELSKLWADNELACTIIRITTRRFERLTETRYTDIDILKMSNQQSEQLQ